MKNRKDREGGGGQALSQAWAEVHQPVNDQEVQMGQLLPETQGTAPAPAEIRAQH